MIKKITFTIILCCMIVSCGKKGDPIYKESKEEMKLENFLIYKV